MMRPLESRNKIGVDTQYGRVGVIGCEGVSVCRGAAGKINLEIPKNYRSFASLILMGIYTERGDKIRKEKKRKKKMEKKRIILNLCCNFKSI